MFLAAIVVELGLGIALLCLVAAVGIYAAGYVAGKSAKQKDEKKDDSAPK